LLDASCCFWFPRLSSLSFPFPPRQRARSRNLTRIPEALWFLFPLFFFSLAFTFPALHSAIGGDPCRFLLRTSPVTTPPTPHEVRTRPPTQPFPPFSCPEYGSSSCGFTPFPFSCPPNTFGRGIERIPPPPSPPPFPRPLFFLVVPFASSRVLAFLEPPSSGTTFPALAPPPLLLSLFHFFLFSLLTCSARKSVVNPTAAL